MIVEARNLPPPVAEADRRKRGEQVGFPSSLPFAKESSPANLTERSETIGSSSTNPTTEPLENQGVPLLFGTEIVELQYIGNIGYRKTESQMSLEFWKITV